MDLHVSLPAETLFRIGPVPITNSMIMTWVTMVILVILAILTSRNIRLIPKGLQNFFESIFEFFLNLIEDVTQNHKQTLKFFPWIMTFFIFIITANWLGLLPGIGSIGIHREVIEHGGVKEIFTPLFRPANTDLNMTFALALISIVVAQIFGIATLGVFKYAKKFINFKSPIKFFVGILELVSEIAKIISFSFRLFGNIFAGEVLLVVMSFLFSFILPIPFMFLEIFVGAVQAVVFAMLTLVFFKMATEIHGEEKH